MKISTKILVGTALILSLGTIFLVIYTYYNLHRLQRFNTKKEITVIADLAFKSLRSIMNTGNPAFINAMEKELKKVKGISDIQVFKSEKVIKLFGLKQQSISNPYVNKAMKEKKEIITENYKNGIRYIGVYKALIANRTCLACHTNAKIGDTLGVVYVDKSMAESDKMIQASVKGFLIVLIIGTIFIIIIVSMFTRATIITPLDKFTEKVKDLTEGEGDLTKKLQIKKEDEIGTVSKYFNKFIEKTREMINDIKNKTSIIESHSKSLASASNQMSSAVIEEMKNTQEIANAINDLVSAAESVAKADEALNNLSIEPGDLVRFKLKKADEKMYKAKRRGRNKIDV